MKKCGQCGKSIEDDEERNHNSILLCEDCYLDIRLTRRRKTHWQYIKSVKNDYLRPSKKNQIYENSKNYVTILKGKALKQ